MSNLSTQLCPFFQTLLTTISLCMHFIRLLMVSSGDSSSFSRHQADRPPSSRDPINEALTYIAFFCNAFQHYFYHLSNPLYFSYHRCELGKYYSPCHQNKLSRRGRSEYIVWTLVTSLHQYEMSHNQWTRQQTDTSCVVQRSPSSSEFFTTLHSYTTYLTHLMYPTWNC